MARPIAVTDEDFETQVEQSALPVLVDFWAKWCGPCKMLGPVVEQIAKDSDGLLTVVKLDVDHNPEVPRKWGVSSLPTLLLYRGEAVRAGAEDAAAIIPGARVEALAGSDYWGMFLSPEIVDRVEAFSASLEVEPERIAHGPGAIDDAGPTTFFFLAIRDARLSAPAARRPRGCRWHAPS